MKIDHAAPATLVWAGPYNWTYHIPEIVGGKCELGMPPDSAGAISRFDAMLFSEVVMGDLEPKKRQLVTEFVKSGGGLVLLGGVHGYGKSHVHVSPLLSDLLPVTTTGLWDLRRSAAGRLAGQIHFRSLQTPELGRRSPCLLPSSRNAQGRRTGLAQRVRQQSMERPIEVPLLVARPYGKGWVVAFLGTPLGEAQNGQTAIWAWEDWGKLLSMVIDASRGKADSRGEEKPTFKWNLAATTPPPPAPQARWFPEPRTNAIRFQVQQVWPAKICFRPGDWASGHVTIVNGTDQPAKGKLSISIISNFNASRQILAQDVSLEAGQTTKVPLVWKIGDDESFGRELRAELTGPDGRIIDAKSEYYTVGWNNYRLGQCQLVQPWTFDQGSKTLPDITPGDRWQTFIPRVRRAGAVVTEYFFWAPDDFGNLTPDEECWFSGQGDYRISQADIHAVIDAAHEHGLAVVTYGKNWMGVAGLQVKRDGVELVRQHPEWCQWMVNGHPKWSFNVDEYRWGVDQAAGTDPDPR